jgi:predicted nucleotidyltransferase
MNTIIETKEMILRLIEESKGKVSKFGVKRLGLFGS